MILVFVQALAGEVTRWSKKKTPSTTTVLLTVAVPFSYDLSLVWMQLCFWSRGWLNLEYRTAKYKLAWLPSGRRHQEVEVEEEDEEEQALLLLQAAFS